MKNILNTVHLKPNASKTVKDTFKFQIIILLIFSLVVLFSCELPHQPGPMPQEIIDLNFEPGLNILGVIRLNDKNAESFVYIEEVLKTKDYYENENEFYITDAAVTIKDSRDSLFNFEIIEKIDSMRYINPSFIPRENETYSLTINATTDNGDLTLTASAMVPTKPSIDTSSISAQKDKLAVALNTTIDAYRYDIVLVFENDEVRKTIFVNEFGQHPVDIKLPEEFGAPLFLGIAAYDKNLTEYLNASSSIIPQTYQEDISTVDNGYGCFGAVSIETYNLEEL